MPQKKIDVVFHVPHYDDNIGTSVRITRITPAALRQLQESVANATLPDDACPASLSIRYEDEMSFLDGGARKNKTTGRRRTVTICNLFYLAQYRGKCPACGNAGAKSELALTRHCATNLRAGRCRDEFMRRTLGAALFPQFYLNEKQK